MQELLNRMRAKKGDDGFTLIELLVVVVIIGVLVAIAVPVYLNYRQGASDKSAQSDVRGAISAVEQYYTNNGNSFPIATNTGDNSTGTVPAITLAPIGTGSAGTITLSEKTKLTVYVASATATTYKICATNMGGSGKWYLYDSSVGGSVKASATALALATCS
jgi:type IV pilus assembly protein PilA